jgi:hypothetical protein
MQKEILYPFIVSPHSYLQTQTTTSILSVSIDSPQLKASCCFWYSSSKQWLVPKQKEREVGVHPKITPAKVFFKDNFKQNFLFYAFTIVTNTDIG